MNNITPESYAASAKRIGCELAVIKGVAKVESASAGFDHQGRVKILFEPFIFYKSLRKKYGDTNREFAKLAKDNPDIIRTSWDATMYGKFSAQWDKLKKAAQIDEIVAMESCSWGLFQIMGFNHELAGYPSVKHMHDAYSIGENEQLISFTNYIINSQLDDELQAKDFTSFARQYNGPLYYKNDYDTKLKQAYTSFK